MLFKPSYLMYQEKENEEELQDEQEGNEKKELFFSWYAEYGLDANIEKIREDFNK